MISKLKKQADKYWSLYIRYRDGEARPDGWWSKCITCQEWKPLKSMQCGHFVSRSCNRLRFDDENTNAQCPKCNLFKSGDRYEYARQLDLKYGNGTAEKLHLQRHINHKLTSLELEEIINKAKSYIKEMEG